MVAVKNRKLVAPQRHQQLVDAAQERSAVREERQKMRIKREKELAVKASPETTPLKVGSMTVDQLRAELLEFGYIASKSAKKAELVAALQETRDSNQPKISDMSDADLVLIAEQLDLEVPEGAPREDIEAGVRDALKERGA